MTNTTNLTNTIGIGRVGQVGQNFHHFSAYYFPSAAGRNILQNPLWIAFRQFIEQA